MTTPNFLSTPLVRQSVSKISQRAEKQVEVEKVLASFVDTGIIGQLDNRNNQILYGRRGTGKTHALKVLEDSLKTNNSACVAFIDCRILGSTSQFSDMSIPVPRRCLMLFKDMLSPIVSSLYEWAVENITEEAGVFEVLEHIHNLEQVASALSSVLRKQVHETTTLHEGKRGSSASVSLGTDLNASLKVDKSSASSQSEKEIFKVVSEEKVHFPDLHSHLSAVLDTSKTELYVLIDEWANIPADLQPYLAEFIKRGLLPVSKCTTKIASLEHKSFFRSHLDGIDIGFEVGADLSASLDLDDYYVLDRNPDQVLGVYSEVIYRHLQANLPERYLEQEFLVRDSRELISSMFSNEDTFKELARAAEGVVRDLINIFTACYFNASRRSRDSIDKLAVKNEAREWFEKDKSEYLEPEMQRTLERIVADVIGKRRARAFMVPRNLQKHPMILKLFDARVLHLVQRGYADKDNPGARYNIYSIDYGTYVDLIGTVRQPDLDLNLFGENAVEEGEVSVPLDDKRSIRRIILREETLEPAKY